MRWFGLILSMVAMLYGCSKATPETENESHPAKPASLKPFDGWNSLKFGMSFDDAFTAEPGITWRAESFRECRDQIPVKGCSLWAEENRSYAPLYAGVALLPRLQFNLDGLITDIGLEKTLESTSPTQCEGAHGRVLDQLLKQWGNRQQAQKASDRIFRSSPAGTTFGRRKASAGGIFVMDIEQFNELPDGRKISLLTTYIPKSEYSPSRCSINVYFDGPKALTRAPLEGLQSVSDTSSTTDTDVSSDDQPILERETSTDEVADAE